VKITAEHVQRAACGASALALGAYGLAAFSPDLTTAHFVQRFHAALVLLLTVAFTLSALRSVTVGASYGIEARLLSAPHSWPGRATSTSGGLPTRARR
jgi:hypothetical protein